MVEKKQFVKRVSKKKFFLLFYGGFWAAQIHHLILATKVHKGAQRKKTIKTNLNKKLLEVQKPFLEKVSGRRRQKLAVDFGLIFGLFL